MHKFVYHHASGAKFTIYEHTNFILPWSLCTVADRPLAFRLAGGGCRQLSRCPLLSGEVACPDGRSGSSTDGSRRSRRYLAHAGSLWLVLGWRSGISKPAWRGISCCSGIIAATRRIVSLQLFAARNCRFYTSNHTQPDLSGAMPEWYAWG